MRRTLALLALSSTLSTACMGSTSVRSRMSMPTIALMGSGFVMMVAGMFVYRAGRNACFEMELSPFDDCSADDTHNILALIFVAGGITTAAVGGIVMTRP